MPGCAVYSQTGSRLKIWTDSREKPHAIRGILAYFDRHGIEHETTALKTGDYMLDGQPNLIVDRKGGLQELCMNLCSKDKARFYREIRRAHDEGIKLIILCEQSGIREFRDIAGWQNKYGRVTGRQLQDAVYRLEVGYNVPVIFCDKRSSGRMIVEILTEGRQNNG